MKNWFARPLTIRAALLAGFGLTLGLWLFAGYQVTLRLREAQRDALAASARYLQAQDPSEYPLGSTVLTEIPR